MTTAKYEVLDWWRSREQAIYQAWKDGIPVWDIAWRWNISAARVREIIEQAKARMAK